MCMREVAVQRNGNSLSIYKHFIYRRVDVGSWAHRLADSRYGSVCMKNWAGLNWFRSSLPTLSPAGGNTSDF
jgi:hypothetical protein